MERDVALLLTGGCWALGLKAAIDHRYGTACMCLGVAAFWLWRIYG